MTELFRLSTYHVPVTVTDEDGSTLDVSNADIQYQMNARGRAGDELFHFTDDDPQVVTSVGDVNEFEVRIDAKDMDVPPKVYEEVRVASGNKSTVVLQRTVSFEEVMTEPQ